MTEEGQVFVVNNSMMELLTFLLFMILMVLIVLMLLVENWLRRGEMKTLFMVTMAIHTIIVMSAYYIIIDHTEGALNFIFYLLTSFLVVKTVGDYIVLRGSAFQRTK